MANSTVIQIVDFFRQLLDQPSGTIITMLMNEIDLTSYGAQKEGNSISWKFPLGENSFYMEWIDPSTVKGWIVAPQFDVLPIKIMSALYTTYLLQGLIGGGLFKGLYTSNGYVLELKLWAGSQLTNASGQATFNITSAGFVSIIAAIPGAELNDVDAADRPKPTILTKSTTSIVVNCDRGVTPAALNIPTLRTSTNVTAHLIVIGF